MLKEQHDYMFEFFFVEENAHKIVDSKEILVESLIKKTS